MLVTRHTRKITEHKKGLPFLTQTFSDKADKLHDITERLPDITYRLYVITDRLSYTIDR